MSRGRSPVTTIFRKETRELLRDRRAVLLAFVLPLILYPVLFLAVSTLPRMYQEELETKALRVGVVGPISTLRALALDSDALSFFEGELDEPSLRNGDAHVFLEFVDPSDVTDDDAEKDTDGEAEHDAGDSKTRVKLWSMASLPGSREARRRVVELLDRYESSIVEGAFRERGTKLDIERLVLSVDIDVSRPDERSATGLGKFLPTLLMLLLLTGGAFASIDLVAGEKERGTLETLWVQAITPRQIIAGKFLVVLVSSLASVALNLVGLLAAVLLGFAPEGFAGDAFVIPPASRIGLVLVLLLPFSVLSSSVLLVLSAYARSYREAQTYLLPLTLVALVPVALAAAPQVSLSSVLAIVPVANVALATREALSGELTWIPLLFAFISTSIYALLALRYAAHVLTREEARLGIESPPLAGDASAEGRARRALVFGAIALLVVYFAGGWLQGVAVGENGPISFIGSLVLTLWGVVLGLAVAYPLVTRQALARTLGFRRVPWTTLPVAVVLGALTSLVATIYAGMQSSFLPFPEELARSFAERFQLAETSGWMAFVVFGLSPGICEELLWRGAFQGELEPAARVRRRGGVRLVLIVAAFFGAFHFSIHRFVPTAFVGGVLACTRLRTRSIWPAIVLHTTHNSFTLLLLAPALEEGGELGTALSSPWTALGAIVVGGLLLLALRASGPRSG